MPQWDSVVMTVIVRKFLKAASQILSIPTFYGSKTHGYFLGTLFMTVNSLWDWVKTLRPQPLGGRGGIGWCSRLQLICSLCLTRATSFSVNSTEPLLWTWMATFDITASTEIGRHGSSRLLLLSPFCQFLPQILSSIFHLMKSLRTFFPTASFLSRNVFLLLV